MIVRASILPETQPQPVFTSYESSYFSTCPSTRKYTATGSSGSGSRCARLISVHPSELQLWSPEQPPPASSPVSVVRSRQTGTGVGRRVLEAVNLHIHSCYSLGAQGVELEDVPGNWRRNPTMISLYMGIQAKMFGRP